jgi:hypothetical protein
LSSRLVQIVLRCRIGERPATGIRRESRESDDVDQGLDYTEQDCRRSKGKERRTEKLSRSSQFRLALNSIILNPKSNNLGIIACHKVPINPRRHHLRCHLGRAIVHLQLFLLTAPKSWKYQRTSSNTSKETINYPQNHQI